MDKRTAKQLLQAAAPLFKAAAGPSFMGMAGQAIQDIPNGVAEFGGRPVPGAPPSAFARLLRGGRPAPAPATMPVSGKAPMGGGMGLPPLRKAAAEPPSLGGAAGQMHQLARKVPAAVGGMARSVASAPLPGANSSIFSRLFGGNRPGTMFGPPAGGTNAVVPSIMDPSPEPGASSLSENNQQYGQPYSPAFRAGYNTFNGIPNSK